MTTQSFSKIFCLLHRINVIFTEGAVMIVWLFCGLERLGMELGTPARRLLHPELHPPPTLLSQVFIVALFSVVPTLFLCFIAVVVRELHMLPTNMSHSNSLLLIGQNAN